MQKKIILITPPFVQLSSPYPASAFLKGALTQENFCVEQYDFSVLLGLKLFSKSGLSQLFDEIEEQLDNNKLELSEPLAAFITKKEQYIDTIEPVISFLQGKYPQLAQKILSRNYLPEGIRFDELKNSKRKNTLCVLVHRRFDRFVQSYNLAEFRTVLLCRFNCRK